MARVQRHYGHISINKAVIERTNLNPSEVGDIVVGTVLAPSSLRAIECRMAAFYVGFPAHFLNPNFHYRHDVGYSPRFTNSLATVVEQFNINGEIADTFVDEIVCFRDAKESFGSTIARKTRETRNTGKLGTAKGFAGKDIVIVAAYRTAIYKEKRGGFKDTLADDLLAPVLKAVIERTNLNPSEVGDIVVGTVLASSSLRAIERRMAAFYVGFPDIVPIRTVNMQC
ncbi:uncharacterized protein LOC121051333 [Rosa chinensis]|uniref:uncharacterized protein LOC121051333 n=1 Tax=Rosa chinensis TaxID=74649 RepID=UPI001AD8A39C|nr:uncharacterized protein LOC121051333 [Rosa chinensis]